MMHPDSGPVDRANLEQTRADIALLSIMKIGKS